MDRYQLAKIVDWAGTLDTRKRMQKVVYLLQVAGCPLEADYILHRYGPYSSDVARLTDEMVRVGLLEEQSESSPVGQQYSYRLDKQAHAKVAVFEKTSAGRACSARLSPFENKALQLLKADLKELEIASTIVFFRQLGHDWPIAIDKACKFKDLKQESPAVERALSLAKKSVD